MSGISFWELVIIFVIGLIVLGPERLPRVANQLGSWLGQARRMTRVMKRQLEEELNFEQELSIRPQKALPAERATTAVRDDTYSPAHAPDGVGTGVADSVVPPGGQEDGVTEDPAREGDPATSEEQQETADSTEPGKNA